MRNSNLAALGREDGTAIVTCRCEDAEGNSWVRVVINARPSIGSELNQLGPCAEAHPSSPMAMPASQILVTSPILFPSKLIT